MNNIGAQAKTGDSGGDKVPKEAVPNLHGIGAEKFTEEQLIEHWQTFISKLKKTDPRIYVALKNQDVKVDNNFNIELLFNNQALVDEFGLRIKTDLLMFLQKGVNNSNITITEKIASNGANTKAVLLSDKDKLKKMIEKNPALQRLRQEFNLDFE